jgi:hypothetical protein
LHETLRGSRIIGRDARVDLIEVSPGSLAEYNFRHVNVDAQWPC